MSGIAVVLFAIAVGFVVAGLVGNLHQLVTNRPPSFALGDPPAAPRAWLAFMIVFSGPFILMRNAIRARFIEQRPIVWLALTSVISAAWSFALGVFVLDLLLAFRSSIAA